MVLTSLAIYAGITLISVVLALGSKLLQWKKEAQNDLKSSNRLAVIKDKRRSRRYCPINSTKWQKRGTKKVNPEEVSEPKSNIIDLTEIEAMMKNLTLNDGRQEDLQETRSTNKRILTQDMLEEKESKKRRLYEINQPEKSVLFATKPPVMWLPRLGLIQEDKRILRNDECLSTRIMDAAQILLKEQFKTEGLQTILNSIYTFRPVQGRSIQFHFDIERRHGFVSCFRKDHVQIADSGYSDLTQSALRQIKECYKDVLEDPVKDLEFLDVDPQPNDYDCGVYAIAYAYELLSDDGDPTCDFQHHNMRSHLLYCLERGKFYPFPKRPSSKEITLTMKSY